MLDECLAMTFECNELSNAVKNRPPNCGRELQRSFASNTVALREIGRFQVRSEVAVLS